MGRLGRRQRIVIAAGVGVGEAERDETCEIDLAFESKHTAVHMPNLECCQFLIVRSYTCTHISILFSSLHALGIEVKGF